MGVSSRRLTVAIDIMKIAFEETGIYRPTVQNVMEYAEMVSKLLTDVPADQKHLVNAIMQKMVTVTVEVK